ncbi:hypothetical protein [Acetobacter persici]|uniref:Uncharacterized protein n=1 Tax=Acetobacter persici TaxID=1076596 RepID=A0A1U9LH80_9PROT|nr:hypothetical protein [Acetobacter persici]AQT05748.1 hypothetical protein A0U91_13965 [Acetobacter persici]MBS0964198.1 hypothetical protein [Acetobacter persici]
MHQFSPHIKKVAEGAYIKQQHKIRGSIAKLKSKNSKENIKYKLEAFHYNLSNALSEARLEIDECQYGIFLGWVDRTIQALAPQYKNSPSYFSCLGGYPRKRSAIYFTRELAWVTDRLLNYVDKLIDHRIEAEIIENLIIEQKYSEALLCVRKHIENYGISYWSIKIAIFLHQQIGGLEAQKDYVKQLRGIHQRGLLSLLSYMFGIRNEDRTTFAKFSQFVESVLKKANYDDDIATYVRFQALAQIPRDSKSLASILKIEQHHNIVDLYETSVGLVQSALFSEFMEKNHEKIIFQVRRLLSIKDFRISKVIRVFEGNADQSEECPYRVTEISDALFSGQPQTALRSGRKSWKAENFDPWNLIYSCFASVALRSLEKHEYRHDRRPALTFGDLLNSIISQDEFCATSFGNLEKLSVNLVSITCGVAFKDFCDTYRIEERQNFLKFGTIGLNSRYLGVEDFDTKNDSTAARQFKSITAKYWIGIIDGDINVNTQEESVAYALHLLRSRDLESVSTTLSSSLCHTTPPLSLFSTRILLAALSDLGNQSALIHLIAHTTARNEASLPLFPIVDYLKEYKWADYRGSAQDLSALIALDAYWKLTDDDAAATLLRYAFTYQLRKSGYARPSEFTSDDYDLNSLIYYLKNICIPGVMDMAHSFTSSNDVLKERQAVCASLKELDPENAEAYDAEIYASVNSLRVIEGMQFVDSSRIHVDTGALTRWARKELEEEYNRYQDLNDAGLTEPEDLSSTIRSILDQAAVRQLYFTPNDESSAIITDIIIYLRDEFMLNSDFGLDYFLSKRIRHQSFIGLIRGPLEFSHLITTRESEFGPYKANTFWIERLQGLTEEKIKLVEQYFNEFSEEFDNALLRLKDDKLQILTSDKPLGLFDLPIFQHDVLTLRSAAKLNFEFPEFLRICYQYFWKLLEPSLVKAQQTIASELKTELTSLIEGLSTNLRDVADGHGGWHQLSMTLGATSTEVQRNLDDAARWFVRPDGNNMARKFTLEESVEIAIHSALKSHKAFHPQITRNFSGDTELSSADLLVVVDSIFIAFDNIKRHSGLNEDIEVDISCEFSAERNNLILMITNTVGSSVKCKAVEDRLERTRTAIASGVVGRLAKREGGSGFLKIAASLKSSAGGRIEFGFVDAFKFRMTLELTPAHIILAVMTPAERP